MYHNGQISSLRWKLHMIIWIPHFDENSFYMRKIYHCDGNPSLLWKFIILMKKSMVVNIHHCDKNLSLIQYCHVRMLEWLKSKPSEQFITVMKIFQFEENSSNQIHHFGDLGSTDQSDQLYFSMFSCIWGFWYVPGCLVGGWLGGVNQD